MNEMDKIHKQIAGLLKAQKYLLHQQPSDMVSLQEISDMISDVNSRQIALLGLPTIPPLSLNAVQALQAAIARLDKAIDESAAATQIVTAATDLVNLAGAKAV